MNRPLINVMSIVDLLQQDNFKDAARLLNRLDQDQAVVITLELMDLVEAPVIAALRKAVKEVQAAPRPEHSVMAALGDCGHAEVGFVRPFDNSGLFSQDAYKAGVLHDRNEDNARPLRPKIGFDVGEVRELVHVIVHDDGAIYQYGENVFIAWDESGAGIAHADTDLESCRRGLRNYAEAISG